MEEPAYSTQQRQLVEQILRFTKGFHRMKTTLTREMPDRAAYNLLYPLVDGDKRASDLADAVHSDPSTISRHVADLVKSDLVQRVADQNDGRATLVSMTEKGRELLATLREQREQAMARALKDWSDDDTKQLTDLLVRFNNDMDSNFNEVLAGFRQALDDADAKTEKIRTEKEKA